MVPSVDNGLTFQATLQNNPFPERDPAADRRVREA